MRRRNSAIVSRGFAKPPPLAIDGRPSGADASRAEEVTRRGKLDLAAEHPVDRRRIRQDERYSECGDDLVCIHELATTIQTEEKMLLSATMTVAKKCIFLPTRSQPKNPAAHSLYRQACLRG